VIDANSWTHSYVGTYNLIGTVNFPTQIVNNSRTAIDNICIHKNRTYAISPIINGLSDHDAQTIFICDIMTTASASSPLYFRIYNKCNITRFQ
jgi:hypothetical protein